MTKGEKRGRGRETSPPIKIYDYATGQNFVHDVALKTKAVNDCQSLHLKSVTAKITQTLQVEGARAA